MTRRTLLGALPVAAAAKRTHPRDLAGLICFWDFQEPPGAARVSRGPYPYRLAEMAGPIQTGKGGLFGGARGTHFL